MRAQLIARWGSGAVAAAALLTACSVTVSGSSEAPPSDVAGYQSALAATTSEMVASSSAAAASATEEAVGTTCDDFSRAVDAFTNVQKVQVAYTKTANWDWPGIDPLVDKTLAAGRTLSGQISGFIIRPDLTPELVTAFTGMKTATDAYTNALQSDRVSRSTGPSTWARSNPANGTLSAADDAVMEIC